ncbi:hypothetical protein CXF89_00690 [Pseudoalteromonas sp. MelDa3]|nr:hypothetical protein CXF89_00690 [Pseudoalteromonas sp. MelDa3]
MKLVTYTEHFSLIISKQQIQNDKDQLVSSTLDIVKDICTAIDKTCEFKLLLWKRAYNLVHKDPHLGIVSIAKTPNVNLYLLELVLV